MAICSGESLKIASGAEKCASRWACAFGKRCCLFLRGRRLTGGVLGTGEDGVVAAGTREQNGKTNGGKHEDDGRVCGELGKEVGCATRAEGCLRTLTAEGSGEIGGFALLEENDTDDKERNDDMQDYD